jgi:hypothetical protein
MIVVLGNWHDLEQSEPISLAAGPKYDWLIRVAKTMAIGLLPLLTFLGLTRLLHTQVPPQLDGYLEGGMIVSVLSGVDPLMKDKVASVKDILSMIPGSERK